MLCACAGGPRDSVDTPSAAAMLAFQHCSHFSGFREKDWRARREGDVWRAWTAYDVPGGNDPDWAMQGARIDARSGKVLSCSFRTE
jgi:hypothetical protein